MGQLGTGDARQAVCSDAARILGAHGKTILYRKRLCSPRSAAFRGGFDSRFRRAEDVELAYRLAARGVDFVFTMSAAGVHYAERSFKSWLETAYMYGRNDAIFARDRKQDWLISAIREEFGFRRRPLRLLILTCMGRPRLSSIIVAGMHSVAGAAGWLALSKVEAAAYSAMFGLRYYQGFLDEIGQPDFFAQEAVPASA